MLIVHGDFRDTDTRVLSTMWEGLNNVKVFTLGGDNPSGSKKDLINCLKQEKDTVLFCGHGSSGGLWYPSTARLDGTWGLYAFSNNDIQYVKAKNIIGIWCHASDFSRLTGCRGFFSSMFVSNSGEAQCVGIRGVDDNTITESEILFCKRVNELLKNNVPISEWMNKLKSYTLTNDVEVFNYNGLYFKE